MKVYAVNRKCVAFSMSRNAVINKSEAEFLVKRMLKQHGLLAWKHIRIDMFAFNDIALYLAYPDNRIEISIADYALPYIIDYFTE